MINGFTQRGVDKGRIWYEQKIGPWKAIIVLVQSGQWIWSLVWDSNKKNKRKKRAGAILLDSAVNFGRAYSQPKSAVRGFYRAMDGLAFEILTNKISRCPEKDGWKASGVGVLTVNVEIDKKNKDKWEKAGLGKAKKRKK